MVDLAAFLRLSERVLLVGPPGIGKTERVRAVAGACGRRLVVMRASLSERVDFGGCLVPDQTAGITRALPLELLSTLRTTPTPTLLFLDDLGQAPIDVQAALMRLFDPGELSEHVVIWGATNRPGDKAGVTALCEPLRSRFAMAFAIPTPSGSDADTPSGAVSLGDWKEELDAWTNWAFDAGMPPEVIAWHRASNGRTLYAWKPHADPGVRMPDYRSWHTVGRLWNAGLRALPAIAASIGKPAAAEFLAFTAIADRVPTPEQVFVDPHGTPVPDDASALFFISCSLATAVEPRYVDAAVAYLARLPRVFGAYLGRDMYRRLGARLAGSRGWRDWFTANSDLFAT